MGTSCENSGFLCMGTVYLDAPIYQVHNCSYRVILSRRFTGDLHQEEKMLDRVLAALSAFLVALCALYLANHVSGSPMSSAGYGLLGLMAAGFGLYLLCTCDKYAPRKRRG